ncbi:hypothetical protein KI688_005039 [Linnemannia hyalina]|uniref:Uncharacterized protein n=1 Tax=Linnemannia hyalina TaxID=64524 RepID=A0A9P7XLK0_9FUNG|nr:hypothetical protein KI688_005039 [Linnemannia hyalina]
MGAELDEKPTEEFCRATHECMWAILTAYRQVDFSLPRGSSESWFNHRLWWFLTRTEPGEIVPQASQHHRNDGRALDLKQVTGLKADGLVYGTAKGLEYCVLEMAKKDQGQFTTKALKDTRKLAKMMKDIGDEIRKLAMVNFRDCLVVYGMRIAGPTATFLYSAPEARAYLASGFVDGCDHGKVIAGRPGRVLAMRKAIVAIAGRVLDWTALPLDGSAPEDSDNGNWIAATLISPPYTSTSQPTTSIEDIPPLVLDATTNSLSL